MSKLLLSKENVKYAKIYLSKSDISLIAERMEKPERSIVEICAGRQKTDKKTIDFIQKVICANHKKIAFSLYDCCK